MAREIAPDAAEEAGGASDGNGISEGDAVRRDGVREPLAGEKIKYERMGKDKRENKTRSAGEMTEGTGKNAERRANKVAGYMRDVRRVRELYTVLTAGQEDKEGSNVHAIR